MDPVSTLASRMLPVILSVMQRLDEQSLQPLKPHLHKVVCFQIEHLSHLYFQIDDVGLQVIDEAPKHCDTIFIGPISAFIAMIFTQKRTHTGLHVRGDMDLAKALYDCWHHLDVDWEGQLANVMGDNFAHFFYQGFQSSKAWASQTWAAREEDLSAYLQDEIKLLPTKLEAQDFFQKVDLLRHDVERLEAKIALMQQRIEKFIGT